LVALERVIFEIRDLAAAYWSRDSDLPGDKVVEAAIVGRMTFLTELAGEFFLPKLTILREIHIVINRFDVSCTFGDFGSGGRKSDSGKCRDIEISAYRLLHLANSSRRKL
jgi:hypothetical protein